MKRMGIEGIYLGGWATSAKGSAHEDPGPDLASYPLSQVPDEAAPIVRALLTADKNQRHARARMTEEQRRSSPEVDFRPFIIADADTGHGGDAHVRNLVRRFVEVGVPGYHIEDQKPGVKKCGHQGGKVLVSEDEQLKRLSAARFQLDIMGVPGSSSPAPTPSRPPCSMGAATTAISRSSSAPRTCRCPRSGPPSSPSCAGSSGRAWRSSRARALRAVRRGVRRRRRVAGAGRLRPGDRRRRRRPAGRGDRGVDAALDKVFDAFVDAWQVEAGVSTYAEAWATAIGFRQNEGDHARDDEGGVAGVRGAALLQGEGEGAIGRGQRHLGLRARQDARRLLPGARRHRLRHREVARRGAVRRPALDGDEDRGPARREAVRRRHPRGLPRQDARLQPLALVQLGHHRDERRADAALPRRSWGSWASSSTSSPTAATRSTASRRRSSRAPSARTACSRWRGCSGSSACSSRATARRRRWSAGRAPTPR